MTSFGRNVHVPKAEAAEQKAECAKDATACEHAWREAGRLWERAADREADPRRKQQYAAKAERARAIADRREVVDESGEDAADDVPPPAN